MSDNERQIVHMYGLTSAQYKQLRICAAQHGMTISKYVYTLLMEHTNNFTDIDLKKTKKE